MFRLFFSIILVVAIGISMTSGSQPRMLCHHRKPNTRIGEDRIEKTCECTPTTKELDLDQSFLETKENLESLFSTGRDETTTAITSRGKNAIISFPKKNVTLLFTNRFANGDKDEKERREKEKPPEEDVKYRWAYVNISNCEKVNIDGLFLLKARILNLRFRFNNVKHLKFPDFLKDSPAYGLTGNPFPRQAEIIIENSNVDGDLITSLGERHHKVIIKATNTTVKGCIRVKSKTDKQQLHIYLDKCNIIEGIVDEVWGQAKSVGNKVSIKRSKIGQWANNTFHNMQEFLLEGNQIGDVKKGALTFTGKSESVDITENYFTRPIQTGFMVYSNLNGMIKIEDNNMTKLQEGAFKELCGFKNLSFIDNHIHDAKTGSLRFGYCEDSKLTTKYIRSNTFHCGCSDLEWLYTAANEYVNTPEIARVFQTFISTSLCEDDHNHGHHSHEDKSDRDDRLKLPPTQEEYRERFASLCEEDDVFSTWRSLPGYAKIAIPIACVLVILLLICIGVKLYVQKNNRDILARVSLANRLNSRGTPLDDSEYPVGNKNRSDHMDLLLNGPLSRSIPETTDATDVGKTSLDSRGTGRTYESLRSRTTSSLHSQRSHATGTASSQKSTGSRSHKLPHHLLRTISKDKNHFAQIVELNVPEETASTLRRSMMKEDDSTGKGWVDAKNEFASAS